MLKFRVRNVVPPGGYFYEVPEKFVTLRDSTLSGLVQSLGRYYALNGIPVPENMAELVEDFICRQAPEGFCYGESLLPRAKVMTYFELKFKTGQLVVGLPEPFVGGGLANTRAETCLRGPKNNRGLCPTCSGMRGWGTQLVGRRVTPVDERLGVCEAATVLTAVLVHIQHDRAASVLQDGPEGCWIWGEA